MLLRSRLLALATSALTLGALAAAPPSPVVTASPVTQGGALIHDLADMGTGAEVEKALKADPTLRDLKNVRGATPLHFAAKNPDLSALKVLLAAGANVNVADEDGFTPLHMAAFERQAEHALLLLEAGADVLARTKAGRTPQAMAEKARADETAGVIALWILKECKPGQSCGIGSPRPVKRLVK